MDHKSAFEKSCREAATRCQRKGLPLQTFVTDRGENVRGWLIGSKTEVDKRGNVGGGPQAWWETCTVKDTTYLSEDGSIGAERRVLYEGPDWPNSRPRYENGPLHLVGNKGNPFSEWKQKVERLGL